MFSSTFQCKFNFQGLFKTALYIQVLFKPVRILSCLLDVLSCNSYSRYVPWVGLQFVIAVFPGHTHLLFQDFSNSNALGSKFVLDVK